MFAKKMAASGYQPPSASAKTPVLKIPKTGSSSASSTARTDDEEDRISGREMSPEDHKFAPSSPTDNMLSPASKLIYRKRPASEKVAKVFSLSHEIPKRICPLPHGCRLVLGSSSHNRKTILETIHWQFSVMVPGIDEKVIRTDQFLELPELIARAKAVAILEQLDSQHYEGECVVLTSDQIVLYHGTLREKPESEEEAVSFLSSYSNDCATTVSAVVATHYPSRRQDSEVDIATVHWDRIPADVVQAVVARGQVYSAAGGFIIEDPDLWPLVKSVNGTVDSVLGMPIDASVRVIASVLEESKDSNAEPKPSGKSCSRTNSNQLLPVPTAVLK